MKIVYPVDSHIQSLIHQEETRQKETLSLIASENYAPAPIRHACSTLLMNKYAEGYPGKRYYAGCKVVDEIEQTAIDRCKGLFGMPHANVQPHAGSQANFAVYQALLKPGETLLGMSLAHGGHLTHGHSVNASGKLYRAVSYGVNIETGLLDYDEIERLAHEHKPRILIAGASAYSRFIDFKRMADIAHSVGAYLLADIAHIAGLVAAGIHPSPAGHADIITSTTHKTLRGPRGAFIATTAELGEKIDRAIIPGTQGGPFMNVIAAKALCFFYAEQEEFKQYQKAVVTNCKHLSQKLEERGLPSITGGTDNHLCIIDISKTGINGKQAEEILESIGITCSRSLIPGDLKPAIAPSGIRLGTAAITTRGMGLEEMEIIADCITTALFNFKDISKHQQLSEEIKRLCSSFVIEE